ncbi:sensor histidine kinase [Hymenobacter canadensis]|uniref:histidine kinase n=1 Tax=Hymenobacter canadensis TaxID=2999067 RepID=A0ABY7LKJ7_9BACT|nr:ATP-binding protein [Hymenobacter canadensis]WBA40967.1 ATP-binding protein [Hymenobacter canadensis]
MDRITSYFMPAGFVGTPDQTRQARIITNTVLLTSLFSFNFLVLCWWAGFWPGMYLMIFNVVAFLVLPFGFRQGLFSYVTFGYIYLVAGYLGVFLNSIYQGGYFAATTSWLVLCPVSATFLLGRRAGIIFFVVSLLSVVGLWELERRGIHLPSTVPPEHRLFWSLDILGGLMLILLVVSVVFDQINQNTLRQLTENNDLLSLRTSQLEQSLNELRATQAMLVHSEKMASLGELTAGIAHEIQNPMNFVNNFSEVSCELLQELPPAMFTALPAAQQALVQGTLETLGRNLARITRHGQRVDGIVRSMLQHAHTGPRERQLTDLNHLATEYLNLAYSSLRAKDPAFHAALHTDLAPDLGLANVVAPDIGRVLLNLFNNALYALQEQRHRQPAGYLPSLTVSTRRMGTEVEIRVRDNGCGMPEEVRQKVFQPFFTTKPAGTGTGLGLSLSHDIVVKGHGGRFLVDSQPGQGTEFQLWLPV